MIDPELSTQVDKWGACFLGLVMILTIPVRGLAL